MDIGDRLEEVQNNLINEEGQESKKRRKTLYEKMGSRLNEQVSTKKSTRAIDKKHLHQDPREYLDDAVPDNTKRGNNWAATTFNTIMKQRAEELNQNFKPLEDCSLEDLPTLLSHFFLCALQSNGEPYNANSLNSLFNGFSRFVLRKFSVEIKNCPEFKIVRETVDRRREEVSKLGKRPGVNASTCVKPSDMQKAYEAGTIGRNNPDALITSVWLVLTQQCGMRAKQEVRNVLNADIVFSTYRNI